MRTQSKAARIGPLSWLVPLLLAAAAGLLLLPGSAGGQAPATVSVGEGGSLGSILVAENGRTLYVFTVDEPGVSNCTEGCIAVWPPLTVEAGVTPTAGPGVPGTLGVITRDDGSRQVTYNDQPLYFFASDSAPGDTNGQGVNDVWFVVTVEAAQATPTAPAGTDNTAEPAPPDAGNAGLSMNNGGAAVLAVVLLLAAAGGLAIGARTLTARRTSR